MLTPARSLYRGIWQTWENCSRHDHKGEEMEMDRQVEEGEYDTMKQSTPLRLQDGVDTPPPPSYKGDRNNQFQPTRL